MMPWDVEKLEKKTQKDPDASKGTPESIQDQRCDQRKPQEVSRRRPETPTAPKRPTKLQKYQILKRKLMVLRKNIKFFK